MGAALCDFVLVHSRSDLHVHMDGDRPYDDFARVVLKVQINQINKHWWSQDLDIESKQ